METKDELLKKLNACNAAARSAREELFRKSLHLSDAVLANRGALRELAGMIAGEIRAFVEADERYTKAVNEATRAREELSHCLYGHRKGGAL